MGCIIRRKTRQTDTDVEYDHNISRGLYNSYERRDRETNMDEPLRCSSLTIEREEHVKTKL
jgi:hypothetical protein